MFTYEEPTGKENFAERYIQWKEERLSEFTQFYQNTFGKELSNPHIFLGTIDASISNINRLTPVTLRQAFVNENYRMILLGHVPTQKEFNSADTLIRRLHSGWNDHYTLYVDIGDQRSTYEGVDVTRFFNIKGE